MGKLALSSHILPLLVFFFVSGAVGRDTIMNSKNSGKWCIAITGATDGQLQSNLDFACGQVDCSIVRPGGSCLEPNNVRNHASVAMNLYYQKTGEADTGCNFNGSGIVVFSDPSYGNCHYADH